jgi:hypothetical protein
MKTLEETRDMFSIYQVNCRQEKTSQAGIGQEEQPRDSQKLKDYKYILGDIQFKDMSKQVNTCALLLFGLFNRLIASKRKRMD